MRPHAAGWAPFIGLRRRYHLATPDIGLYRWWLQGQDASMPAAVRGRDMRWTTLWRAKRPAFAFVSFVPPYTYRRCDMVAATAVVFASLAGLAAAADPVRKLRHYSRLTQVPAEPLVLIG